MNLRKIDKIFYQKELENQFRIANYSYSYDNSKCHLRHNMKCKTKAKDIYILMNFELLNPKEISFKKFKKDLQEVFKIFITSQKGRTNI